jgi:DNA adenine methylase
MSVSGGEPLRAPFPWFGGKSRVAPDVWAHFGDVANYVEPFAGSLAVLLARPHPPRTETVNDRDAQLANFWRALKADPDGLAFYADWPVNEVDLHARHRWLVTTGAARVARLEHDPDYYDLQAAGWWVWGVCAWIASGWCQASADDPERRLPHLSTMGMGVHRTAPDDSDALESPADDADEGPGVRLPHSLPHSLPHLGGNRGIHRRRSITVVTFRRLSERLRHVRVACGNWTRVMGESVTFRHGMTGVFLNPPYAHRERSIVYAVDDDVSADVRAWAIVNGKNPLLRIALCGYEGEHPMPSGWTCIEWKAVGGYGSQGQGRGRANARRERVWFSPACLPVPRTQTELFEELPKAA